MQNERKGIRSRSGCWTCRERKIKCDETHPICQRCVIGKRVCDYSPKDPPRRPTTVRAIRPWTDLETSSSPGVGTGGTSGPPVPFSYATQSPRSPSTSQEGSVRTPSTPLESEGSYERSGYALSHEGSPGPLPGSPPVSLVGESSAGLGELSGDSPQEKRILEHFQSQFLSTMQTKTAKFSFVAGIMHICQSSSSPVLMHMMLAIVGHQASGLDESKDEQMYAIEQYRKGLAGFATLVGSGQYERHTLLAAFWILIQFEMRFGETPRDISRHFDGFNTVLLAHGPSLLPQLIDTSKDAESDSHQIEFQRPFRTPLLEYKNVVNRLGLWVAYLDACASTFDLGGSVMATMQRKYPGSLDRIFSHSRDALRELWGEEYPREQEMDDIQNRPAFDLFHHAHILRFKVSEMRHENSSGHRRLERIRDLQAEIENISEQYSSLISVVEGRDPGPSPPSRLVLNLRFIVAFFHAAVLEFNRVAYFSAPLPPQGRRAVERILDLALVVHECEGNHSLSRMAWAIFMAGVEAWDRVHQNWLMERLQGLSVYGKNMARAHRLLEAIVRQQRNVPGRVDYFKWFRNGDFEQFVIV